jgi:uncharacterized metal-binding protein
MSSDGTEQWAFVGFSEKCDLCGGNENVHRYRHTGTGEQKSLCNPCEQAGGE